MTVRVTRREAQAATDEGVERSFAHAQEEWKDMAHYCIWRLAKRQGELTSDDVWQELEDYAPEVTTQNGSAMGGVMRRAARDQMIEITGRKVQSLRPSSHQQNRPVWRSLLFDELPWETVAVLPHGKYLVEEHDDGWHVLAHRIR